MRKQDFQAEHLKQLPLRAIVAFAVRCARRVQSLAELPEGHPKRERLRGDVEAALRMAEGVASGSPEPVSESVVEALDANRRAGGIPLAAESAAAAASEAAHVAVTAWLLAGPAETWGDETGKTGTSHTPKSRGGLTMVAADVAALEAFTAAVDAYQAVGLHNEDFVAAALGDYEKLLRLKLGRYPDAGSPVDPSSHGPLGPL